MRALGRELDVERRGSAIRRDATMDELPPVTAIDATAKDTHQNRPSRRKSS